MKVTTEAICTRFVSKVSGSGNTYYQVDLTETIETGNPDIPKIDRTFKDLYYNIGKAVENHSEFIGMRVVAGITIYPIDRKVGEKVYQDIKLTLESIELKQ